MSKVSTLVFSLKRIIRSLIGQKKHFYSLALQNDKRQISPLDINRVANFREYQEYASGMADEYTRRASIEARLAANHKEFNVQGYCVVCQKHSLFHADYQFSLTDHKGNVTPNWRERLICQWCGMNNRMRASLHIFEDSCCPTIEQSIYITEQTTPVFGWVDSRFSNVVGSEYLGKEVPFGRKNFLGIRNESLTSLSFTKHSFDYLLCFDVFEHIPEYDKAIKECFRVLKPGGSLIFSVPFDLNSPQNIVRACLNPEGEIKHLLSPEYHGDPLNDKGCLCFYHFGWELLENMRAVGFNTAYCLFYWSLEYGYLGGDQFIFMAQK